MRNIVIGRRCMTVMVLLGDGNKMIKARLDGMIIHRYCNPIDGVTLMQPLKKQAMDTIANLPDNADIDEIMYRLYVLDKIRKGREAVEQGHTISHEDLRREIEQW